MERDELTYCVYAIRCKANGKVYIGISKDVEKRIKQHWYEKRQLVRASQNPKYPGKPSQFVSDFAAYESEGFEVYVLERDIPARISRRREDYWICEYQSDNPRYGYNRARSWSEPDTNIIYALPPNLSKSKEE